MKRAFAALMMVGALAATPAGAQEPGTAQARARGLAGDPAAIADAQAMVETMGGMALWAQLRSLHFVHEWYPWNRVDSYIENEILDLAGPRSWADRKSEINHTTRAYSPEGKRWDMRNGAITVAGDDALANDLARATSRAPGGSSSAGPTARSVAGSS